MHGFVRVASAVNTVDVANSAFNAKKIIDLITKANGLDVAVILFPELCVTGYTVGDFFFQRSLYTEIECALKSIINQTKYLDIISIIGAPTWHQNRLYNSAIVLQKGKILGVVPKIFIPNHKEFYEKRYFSSGKAMRGQTIRLVEQEVPFGIDLLFGDEQMRFGVEVCEDLWSLTPPSFAQASAGALLHFNPSASNELIGKDEYRSELVASQSARCMSGYIYSSAGVHESTSDTLFGGSAMIYENGVQLAKNRRFTRHSHLIYADIDIERLRYQRLMESSFADNPIADFRLLQTSALNQIKEVERFIDKAPFVPSNETKRDIRCEEIFAITSNALAKRLEAIGTQKVVIGLSGGLDSTLAVLSIIQTYEILGFDKENILAISMPCFGTTSRTQSNAQTLANTLGVSFKEIDIQQATYQHFKDIGHDKNDYSVTYENAQARERTQILLDVANKVGGIVVGTGDLSEIALGFATYAGDHISMYHINAGIPKTLIQYLIDWVAKKEPHLSAVLHDILDTPISPELLPQDNDTITQVTEDIIGSYRLHDFFLYHFLKYGASPCKIFYLAQKAFDEYEAEYIKEVLKTFLRRFVHNQFKRNCSPDGIKVGSISLSPRADLRLPSDMSAHSLIKQLALC